MVSSSNFLLRKRLSYLERKDSANKQAADLIPVCKDFIIN